MLLLAGCVNKTQENTAATNERQWRRVGGSLVAMDDSARGVTCYASYVETGRSLSCIRTLTPAPVERVP